MKKITLLVVFLLTSVYAQSQVVAYSFSQSTGTYTEITGGTLLGSETSDDQRFLDPATPAGGTTLTGVGLPIGFNFVFNGVTYDRFAVNNNGWISFGMSSLGATAVNMNTTSAYTPLGSVSTAVSDDLVARISGLGRDLQAQTGATLRYELIGTAPNRTLVIQFKNYKKYGTTGTGDNFNFQIRLNETTNVVEVVFGTMVNNATSSTYEVGLRANPAATASNFNSRTSTTSWSATTSSIAANNAITMDASIIPASGLTFTWTPPTCPGATGITLANLTSSSADVTWAQPTPVPSNGYEYVITSTAGLPTGAGTTSTTNSASVSGLTDNTTYYVYVRSNCGTSFGNWILVGTFKTLCNDVTAFVQNFDTYPSGTTSLPDCWSKLGSSANVYITTGAVSPMSPANRLYMNVSATTTAFAVMAPVSNLQANTHRLKFKAYCTTANKSMSVGYFLTPGDVNSYVEIEPVQLPSTAIASTQEFTIIPTGIPAGIKQLVFNIVQPTPSATTVYIDDVKWEFNSTCVEPSALTASLITNSSATLGWTNGGAETEWNIQYGPTNFALGTGTIVNTITTNPYVLGGLTSNTSYQYYVRAVCTGPINSSWSGPYTFKTQCDDVTTYTENFDTYATGSTSPMPDCWSKAGAGSTYITTGAVAPMSPANRLYMFASSTATPPTESYAVLPAVSNLQANTHRLKLKGYTTVAGRFIEVGYMTDPSDVSTYVQLQEIFLPSTVIANTQEFTIVPTGIPAGVKHLAIKNPGFPSSTTTAYIDDVKWEAIPACPEPISLTASNITSNSADLGWTEMGTATAWNIEYGPTGFAQGSGTTVSGVNTNPYTLGSLAPATTFDYYVQAACGGTSGNSVWIGPYTFTTLCVPFVAPYSQNFDSLPLVSPYRELPNCWETQVGPDYWTVTNDVVNTGHTYLPNIGDHTTGTSNYLWIDASSDITANEVVTPLIDMSGLTTPTAGFWFASNNTNNSINHTIALDVWNGTTWLNLATQTGNFTNWVKVEATVPSTVPTTTKFRIYAIANPNGTSADYYYNDLGIDDFFVIETPLSAPSCSTNLVATPNASCGNFSNSLTWNSDPIATGYYISVGTTSGGTDIANNLTLTSSSYSFVGTINTTYYWTVTPFNANGSATGCVEQSFTTAATGCYCTSLPTSNDDLGITNVQLGSTNFANGDVTYFDHTATAVSLSQGLSTNLQVSFATGYTYNTYVWIDFNDNFIFDASELVYSGESLSANPTVLDASFMMPATAALGTHRMRIVTADYLPAPDPCYSGDYGVTLDFSVTIIPAPTCIPPTALTATAVTSSSANLGWTENGTATLWDIEWGASGFTPTGTPNITGTTTNPHTLPGLSPNTAYSFYVRSDCGGTNGTSAWSGPYTFTTACSATNVPYVMDFESATVPNLPACTSRENVGTGNLWTVANNPGYGFTTKVLQYLYNSSNAANVWFYTQGVNLTAGTTYAIAFDYGSNSTSYVEKLKVAYGTSATATAMTNVIVDLPSISNNTPLNSSTQFTPATSGVYYFGFNIYSAANQYNLYVDNINVDVFLNSNSFDNNSFVAYPNPVKDVLNLSYSSEITSVKVVNLLGQEVISRKVGNTSTQVDMTNLSAGAYIVNVTIGDAVKSIKVIKQ